MKQSNLHQKYPTFEFLAYEYQVDGCVLKVTYTYRIPELSTFGHSLAFPIPTDSLPPEIEPIISKLVFALGFLEAQAYWKLTLSPVFSVKCENISKHELFWFKEVFRSGLWEFFYQHSITRCKDASFVTFTSGRNKVSWGDQLEYPSTSQSELHLSPSDSILILFGGGKDSLVTTELLTRYTQELKNLSLMSLGSPPGLESATLSSVSTFHQIKRQEDIEQYLLREEGFYYGQGTPSLLHVFSGLITAVLHNNTAVLVSNELSAEEPNTTYLGQEVNHQWSKTLAAEQMIQTYINTFLKPVANHPVPQIGSPVRMLNEVQLSLLFAKLCKNYIDSFVSCNSLTSNGWCGRCPKCIFASLCHTPFLGDSAVKRIFGNHPLDNLNNLVILQELLGISGHKPLDCVGTIKDSRIAFWLTKKYYQSHTELKKPALLKKITSDQVLFSEDEVRKHLRKVPLSILPIELSATISTEIESGMIY